jgi:hypothetical protein
MDVNFLNFPTESDLKAASRSASGGLLSLADKSFKKAEQLMKAELDEVQKVMQ